MQVFEHDLSPHAPAFMKAKSAFDAVFDYSTESRLEDGVSTENLTTFVDSWLSLDDALPTQLKDQIHALPKTDSAVIVSGLPVQGAELQIGYGYVRDPLNFPTTMLSSYACQENIQSESKTLGDFLEETAHLEWHFDNKGQAYLLSMLGINKGQSPCATALLSAGTALQNPDFLKYVTAHKPSIVSNPPISFADILDQSDSSAPLSAPKVRGAIKNITTAISPSHAVVLESGQALMFFNPNLMHGRLNHNETKAQFPEVEGSEFSRKLLRHFTPLGSEDHLLLKTLRAAQQQLGR